MLLAGLLLDSRESVPLPALMFPLKNKSQSEETGVELYKLLTINALVFGFQRSRGCMEV